MPRTVHPVPAPTREQAAALGAAVMNVLATVRPENLARTRGPGHYVYVPRVELRALKAALDGAYPGAYDRLMGIETPAGQEVPR